MQEVGKRDPGIMTGGSTSARPRQRYPARSLRIAFVTEQFPRLSEAFIASSAGGLIEAGHSVRVIALDGSEPRSRTAQPSVEKYNLLAGLCRPALPASASWLRRLVNAPRAAHRLVQARGLMATRAFNPWIFRRSAFSLRALYLAEMLSDCRPFDIIHCQFGHLAHDIIRLRKAGFLTGKVVVHFRGFDITQIARQEREGFYRSVFQTADRFVANSAYFRDRAVAIGCPEDLIDVSYSGVELERFVFRKPHIWRSGDVLKVFTVGRLVEKKGYHVLLAALSGIARKGIDFRCDIVGDGPDRAALEAQALSLGIGERIVFHGALAHPAIVPLLNQAHLFAAPSLTAANSNADAPINTLKEAMAVGVPVISTYHGGIPELVVDGVSGYLAQENDVSDLQAAIETALRTVDKWPHLAQAARQTVETKFSLAETTETLVSIYRKALAT